jgi:hypothetical protein
LGSTHSDSLTAVFAYLGGTQKLRPKNPSKQVLSLLLSVSVAVPVAVAVDVDVDVDVAVDVAAASASANVAKFATCQCKYNFINPSPTFDITQFCSKLDCCK